MFVKFFKMCEEVFLFTKFVNKFYVFDKGSFCKGLKTENCEPIWFVVW